MIFIQSSIIHVLDLLRFNEGKSCAAQYSAPMTMVLNLYRVLNYAAFTFFSVLLVCLIILTPADAIYQCYKTHRLINIFFITGAYVATFILQRSYMRHGSTRIVPPYLPSPKHGFPSRRKMSGRASAG